MFINPTSLKAIKYFMFLTLMLLSQVSIAMPGTLNFQARILTPSNQPLELPSVDFKFKYTNAASTCVLYEENFDNVSMVGSNGLVTLNMGAGTKIFPLTATNLYDVFNYGNSIDCLSVGITGNTGVPIAPVTPTVLDKRQVIVEFNDGSGWQGLPSMSLNSVPYSLHARMAYNSNQLGGVAAANYIKFSDVVAAGCIAGQALRYDGTNFVCETTGGGSVTSVAGRVGAVTLSSGDITGLTFGTAINTFAQGNDSRFTDSRVPSGAASGDLTGTYPNPTLVHVVTAGTSSKVTFDAKGRIVSSAALVSTDVTGLTFGTAANTFAQGNDSRFTDSRVPSGAASGDLTGTYPNPTLATTGVVASSDYTKVTVDEKGRVTSAGRLTSTDLTTLYGYTPANAASAWTLNGSGDITRATGNVGIGIANPTVNLEVSGEAKINGLTVGRGGGAADSNIAFGTSALNSNVGGNFNTAVGNYALAANINATQNTAIGYGALSSNTAGSYNMAVGHGALGAATSSTYNTAIGIGSMGGTTNPSTSNVGLGFATLFSVTGQENVGLGVQALRSVTTGSYNIAVGARAGYGDNTPNQRSTVDTYATFVGYSASRSDSIAQTTLLTNITAIGKNAKVAVSNAIVLGGTGADSVFVGIGKISPAYSLDVAGDINITGNFKVNGMNISTGGVTTVTALAPLVSSGGASPDISLARSTAAVDGYLASSDFTTFNSKLSSTLNSGLIFVGNTSNVATAIAVSGDATLNSSGDLTLVNSSTTRANLGLGTAAVFNVPVAGDAGVGEVVRGTDSRLTNSRAPAGAASGDLTGTYPNPTLAATGVVASNDYTKVTVDEKGRVISAGRLASTDITTLYGYTPANNNSAWSVNVSGDVSRTTGKVGIGTSNPTTNFHIEATDSSPSIFVQNTSSTALQFPGVSIVNYSGSVGGHPYISLQNAGGTLAAPTALPVGSVAGGLVVRAHNGTSFIDIGRIMIDTDTGFGGSNHAGLMRFLTGNSVGGYTEKMRINSAGNMGVGTTQPQSKLSVVNSLAITNSAGIQHLLMGNQDSAGVNHPSIIRAANGNLEFGTGTSWSGIGGTFTSKLWLGDNGNVGIGTTTPTQALTVVGLGAFLSSDSVASATLNPVSGSNSNMYLTHGAYNSTFGLAAAAGAIVSSAASGDVVIRSGQANDMLFAPNGTEKMRITSSGLVGIGTSNPTSKLDVRDNVDGNVGIKATNENGTGVNSTSSLSIENKDGVSASTGMQLNAYGKNSILTLFAGTVPLAGKIHFRQSANVDNTGIIFQGSNANSPIMFGIGATEIMRLNASGNVGIGTTSPGAKLDVTDTSTTTSAIIVPRAGNFTGTNVNGMIRYNSTSTLFEFRQNGAWVNYTTVSDGRLKTHVKPIVNSLDIVKQLRPVYYDWDRSNPKATSFQDKQQIGFIAQDVEKVLPEVVNKGEDSYRSLEYDKMVAVAIAAIKELYVKVMGFKADQAVIAREIASVKAETASKANKAEVDQLKAENAKLKADTEKQKQENAAIKARLDKIEKMLKSK